VLRVLADGQFAAAADEETSRLASGEGLDQLGPRHLLGVSVDRYPDTEPDLGVVGGWQPIQRPVDGLKLTPPAPFGFFRRRPREDRNGFEDIWDAPGMAAIWGLPGSRR
jgi:hypothetical protein